MKRNIDKLGRFIALPKVYRNCLTCGKEFIITGPGRAKRIKTAKFCRPQCRYDFGLSEETKNRIRNSELGEKNPFYGRKHTKETIEKIKEKRALQVGENHPNWKGGITPIKRKLRNSLDYEEWRKSVFERDNYTCQGCGTIGEYLHADHIKSFSDNPELRFEVSNGRTLCVPCHYKITFNKEITKYNKWGHRNFNKKNLQN